MQVEHAVSARGVGALLLCLGACSPGPTLVLGRLPDEDAGRDRDDESDEDAGIEPCESSDACRTQERPYCNNELERCVECTRERHCEEDEFCGERSGRCIPNSQR